jgi:hypothetical protein
VVIAARVGELPEYFHDEWHALRRARVPAPSNVRLRNVWAWVIAVIVAGETAYLLLVVYVLPPGAWDALKYHLTAVASWLQGNRILITPLILTANVYPMNGELTFLWVGALAHSDLLVDRGLVRRGRGTRPPREHRVVATKEPALVARMRSPIRRFRLADRRVGLVLVHPHVGRIWKPDLPVQHRDGRGNGVRRDISVRRQCAARADPTVSSTHTIARVVGTRSVGLRV